MIKINIYLSPKHSTILTMFIVAYNYSITQCHILSVGEKNAPTDTFTFIGIALKPLFDTRMVWILKAGEISLSW